MATLAELEAQLKRQQAELAAIKAAAEETYRQIRLLRIAAHRREVRRHKWLWWRDNNSYTRGQAPPPYGAKVQLVLARTKWCRVLYKGRELWAPYYTLSVKPVSETERKTNSVVRELARGLRLPK